MDISFVLRKSRKAISSFTLVALLSTFASFGIAQAGDFSDVASDHYALEAIEYLNAEGVMSGNGDGTFAPDRDLSRYELAKILVEGFAGGVDENAPSVFSDVPEGEWFTPYVNTAKQAGIMNGEGNGDFNGAAMVNRAVLAQAVVNAAGLSAANMDNPFNDVDSDDWFYDAVVTAYSWSMINGMDSNTFAPASNATRGQAAIVTKNGMNPVEREVEVESSDATLRVSVSNDSPAGDDLPSLATSVEVYAVDLEAQDDDVEIDSVTFSQYALSDLPTDHSLYAYAEIDGVETRLSSAQTLNSNERTVKFNNLNLSVDEGEEVRLALRMDVGTVAASSIVGFEIIEDGFDADGADVRFSGDMEGGEFTLSAADTVGTLTVEKNGTVDSPQIGEQDVTIAKFKLSAATEDAHVEEIGLFVSGSINLQDIGDYELYINGESDPVATVDSTDSLDVARFMLDGVTIEKGSTKSFYVTADLNTGRNADTIETYIDEDTDILATGDKYGFGMQITRTLYDGNVDSCASTSSNDCSYSTLQGGDITITSNGPSAMDIAVNENDVTLMNFSIASVTEVTFKNFPISLTVTDTDAENDAGLLNGTTSNFTDIKIIDTDSGDEIFTAVDSNVFVNSSGGSTAITDATDDNAQAFHLYTDDLTVEAGSLLNLAIVADVENNSDLSGETIVASLDLNNGSFELRDVNNKVLTNADVLVPATDITGKTHTIQSPSLDIALASTPVSNTYVKGSEDIEFAGIVFTCGEASDCRVTDLTVNGDLATGGDSTWDDDTSMSTYVNSLWLVDVDGNIVEGAESVSSSTGDVTFDNIDYTFDAGSTEILYLVGDLSSDSAGAIEIAFNVTASSDITVEDDEGNSFTASGTANTTSGTGVDPATFVTTSTGGTLTISVDASTAREDIVVGGSSDVEVSTFKLAAADEAFTVSKLALQAFQIGAAASDLAEYADAMGQITISYEDADGATQEATGYLSEGTATFTGMDIYVPADGNTTITAYADVNSVSGNTALAGDRVGLAVAFNNFEALAADSGETYNADKIDATNGKLAIGTVTYTDSTVTLGTTASAQTLGATATITTADLNDSYPVGTLILTDDDGTYDSTNSTLFVLTSTYDDDDTSFTGIVIDDADGTPNSADGVYYALPGTGFFSGTNNMYVYESKPSVTLASSSPSGDRNTGAEDTILTFTVSAEGEDSLTIPSIVLDLASNAAMEDTSGTVTFSIKEGSTTYLTDSFTLTDGSTSAKSVTIDTVSQTLEIAPGTSKTLDVIVDTTALIPDTSGDQLLTPSIDLGGGNFTWNDGNGNVTEMGNVPSSIFYGNTLTY